MMQEEFKYFISYSVDFNHEHTIFRNKEIKCKLIESEEDIREIEKQLKQGSDKDIEIVTVLNYRMF
jgi:hypothetical protein